MRERRGQDLDDGLDGGEDYFRRREMYNTHDAGRRDRDAESSAADASRLVIGELEEEIAQMSRRNGLGRQQAKSLYESPRKGNRFADSDPSVNSFLDSLL